MINEKKVKLFWDTRAETYGSLPYESIANLEQNPENLQLKIKLETEKIFSWIGDIKKKSVLDLGAGVGQWSFRFIEQGAKEVVAVEYSEKLAKIARKEIKRRKYHNVHFLTSPAEAYTPLTQFDIIYISGLLVYMNDKQLERLIRQLPKACHSTTMLILRDGVGIHRRHEILDCFSDHLQTHYSAIYRTYFEYIKLFKKGGFHLIKNENMFDESCSLNKYAETRLHLFHFEVKQTCLTSPQVG